MYKTNFFTSLKTNFKSRQYNYIFNWFLENKIDFDLKLIRQVQFSINNWTHYKSEPINNQLILDFISSQKLLLSQTDRTQRAKPAAEPPEGWRMCDTWIMLHPEQIVKYYYHILKFMDQCQDKKKFTLAPVSSIKSHFLRIDVIVLYNILKNINLTTISETEFKENKEKYFSTIFEYKKHNFSYIIDTDGVSACFHYKEKIKSEPVSKYAKIHLVERVIGIDPGRTNIIYAAEKIGKVVKKYRLTRKAYYSSSGITRANKRNKKWQKQLHEQEQIYANHSIKTVSNEEWELFLQDYISVYQDLWRHKTQKKYARERFRTYILKRKTLDVFFTRFVSKDLPEPDIAYGAAGFKSTGYGELSAPKSSVMERCKKRFRRVGEIDEYRTTKICNDCNNVLQQVRDSKYKEVRGLSRCCSTER
jgi:hypothetical protein